MDNLEINLDSLITYISELHQTLKISKKKDELSVLMSCQKGLVVDVYERTKHGGRHNISYQLSEFADT